MNGGNRVTQKDIARKLNVSQTTVANALNGKDNITEELREKIIKTAKEMGYRPNSIARAMVKNGISLALVLGEEPREFNDQIRLGIDKQLNELFDYKVELVPYEYTTSMSDEEGLECLMEVMEHEHDGILFSPNFHWKTHVHVLHEHLIKNEKVKLVFLSFGEDDAGIPFVCDVRCDSVMVAKVVAELIYLKFGAGARIGVITTDYRYGVHREEVRVFCAECERMGMTVVDVLENSDIKEKTYAATAKLLEEHPDIDVIFKTSFDSVHVCKCIEDKGFSGKVKVIAHDVHRDMIPYIKEGDLMAVAYQNPELIGRIGVQKAVDAIIGNDTETGCSVKINPEIVLRSNIDNYVDKISELFE